MEVRDRFADGRASPVSGVTIDVSQGGVRLLLDEEISIGPESDCLVRFVDAEEVVSPEYRWGKALRSAHVDAGYEVAIQFQAHVDVVEPRSPRPF